LRQDDVAHQRDSQKRPIQRRKRGEPEVAPHRRKRQGDADGHDHRGHYQEWPRGDALQERDSVGTDDVDDERLRQQALHEPPRLEQARAVGRGFGRRDVPATEEIQHHEERGVVEDRRARANEYDVARQLPDVPRPRLLDLFGVHVVGGNSRLADVVEHVVGQNLDRCHRQEGYEHAGPQHAEHVPEIAARPQAASSRSRASEK
jgi:hypothetical protein